MAPYTAYHQPGDLITYTVGATTVADGDLVELSGDRTVIPAQADSVKCVGFAVYGGVAGEKIAVAAEGVWPVNASGNLAVGDQLVCAAAGDAKVVPAASAGYVLGETTIPYRIVGIALEAIATGTRGRVKLKI